MLDSRRPAAQADSAREPLDAHQVHAQSPRSSRSPEPASENGRGSGSPSRARHHGALPARALHPARRRSGGLSSRVNVPRRRPASSISPRALLAALVALLALAAVAWLLVIPACGRLLGSGSGDVAAGQHVTVSIPEGASGDDIVNALLSAHVIADAKAYYAEVERLDASRSLKPGDYAFTTGEDLEKVVRQLMAGPNIDAHKLTVAEGLTVAQTAAVVEKSLGIKAADFIAQAKASNYVGDYPFLEGAYDDSLEGYLFPKTYTFDSTPTADQVIRKLLDQFRVETKGLSLDGGQGGLSARQLVTLASLVERETAVDAERPTVASVIYNRLSAGMPLQIDAAIVYARGGGSQAVTYSDLEIDSPYNVYRHTGLTPGPICSPSLSSLQAAVKPASTSYLYYVASPAGDGTHRFSETYEQFLVDKKEYDQSEAAK